MRISFIMIITCAILGLATAVAFAADEENGGTPTPLAIEMYPLEALQPGMRGVGYTVIRGIEIESFNVEILELIPDGGFDGGPLVLAKFTGEVVDFSDGIAGGYSGSPVYLEGKLLGAVSTAIPMTDTHIGGITPIQSMLAALHQDEDLDYSTNTVLPETDNNGEPIADEDSLIAYVDDIEQARRFNDSARANNAKQYAAVPCFTPVYCSGISPQVRDELSKALETPFGSHLKLMDTPTGKATDYGLLLRGSDEVQGLYRMDREEGPPLVPGDAISVSLMQGDIEMYGVGTLTYSDEDGRFLAFGHPLFQVGSTNVPVGKAYITWTHKSLVRAFKTGVRLNTVGTLTQDRAAACGGNFNVEPEMIPVWIKVNDVDTDNTESLRFEVMRHPDYTPLLIAMGAVQAINQVVDRQPRGTMKLSYHIEGVGLREHLRRTNYHSDDLDATFSGALDVGAICSLLETNIYREVKITDIKILIELTMNRINASIDDAEIITAEEDQVDEGESADIDNDQVSTSEEVQSEIEGESDEEESSENQQEALVPSATEEDEAQEDPTPEEITEPLPEDSGVFTTPGLPGETPIFKPGEVIRVKVRLQPYREEAVWREFKVKIPEDFPAGLTRLVVHGGGDLISMSMIGGKGRSLVGIGPIIDTREYDLDSILDQIIEAPLNNELLLTLYRPYDYTDLETLDYNYEEEDHIDSTYQMEWVIYNGFELPIEIVTDETLAADELINGLSDEVLEQDAEEDESDNQEAEQEDEDNYIRLKNTPVRLLDQPGDLSLSNMLRFR